MVNWAEFWWQIQLHLLLFLNIYAYARSYVTKYTVITITKENEATIFLKGPSINHGDARNQNINNREKINP